MEDVTITLNPIDAALFLEFRKHQTDFMVLFNNGIFTLKNGSLTIHKDSEGLVRKIEINQVLFKA